MQRATNISNALFSVIAVAGFLLASFPVDAQPCASLYVESASVSAGAQATIRVTMDSSCPFPGLAGWSFGVCHDPTVVEPITVLDGVTTATVDAGGPPFFNAVQILPGEGFTVGVALSFGTALLGAGLGYELNVATYDTLATSGTSPIEFCDYLSTPPVDVVIALPTGAVVPTVNNGSITIQDEFVRGDCSPDSSLNIADGTFLLNALFPALGTMPVPPCLDACDCNDDGALNITDAICIFSAIFAIPPTTIPPPSASCGQDPNSDALSCLTFAPCP